MLAAPLSFVHVFEPGRDDALPPLLLLHGTGADETDLLPVGRMIAPGAALLAPRGKVLEHGRPRFFRRFAEGVFDEDDLRRQAADLADFVASAQSAYGLGPPVAVGFSNGANIAAAVLLLRPEALAGAILLRAMVPLADPPAADLSEKPVLLASGALDPIVPAANAARLAAMLSERGAALSHHHVPGGHGLTRMDIDLAKSWLAARAPGIDRIGSS